MSKPTAGPWWVAWGGFSGKDPGRVATIYATDDQELRIVAHVPHDMNHAEHEPTPSDDNTRLIAAAPDLLEALTAAENALAIAVSYRPVTRPTDADRFDAALTKARVALSKARGEP